MNAPTLPRDLEQLFEHLARIAQQADDLPEDDTPAGILTRDFLVNNWGNAHDGLLKKTSLIRVNPENSVAPRRFRFEIDCPYKRKVGADAPVELMPGPVRGMIHYRPDMFMDRDAEHIAVQLDPDLAYFHPNCARERGHIVCVGKLPESPFPFPLDVFLENHLYPILTYQNRSPADLLDPEAAKYFALDPGAMDGLEPVKPLY